MRAGDADLSPERAFERYEAIRARLPAASFGTSSRHAQNLAETVAHFDGFILDAFGVLNRGETPVPGAPERIAALRAMGKKLTVLTNAASYTRAEILAKYRRLGFDFSPGEVVSSRDLAFAGLPRLEPGGHWAAAALAGDSFEDAPCPLHHLLDDPSLYERAGGFLLLSSGRWQDRDTVRLARALRDRPRPVVVANPDLVAPREDGLTIEPGTIGYALISEAGAEPVFFGKPGRSALAAAMARMPGVPPHRIAMVGDTLHTDILGGRAAGLGTVLVTGHGLFRGRDTAAFIERSGIRPDWIVPTT